MTVGGDFIPSGSGADYEVAPSYPKVFGVSLTPTVSGILIALLGLAGAVYLLVNLVQPAWQQNQTLRQDIATKESQLLDQEETQQRIRDAREDLQEAKQLQADVLALFANEEGLDTLLIDLNERIQAQAVDPNQARGQRAALQKFEATTPEPEVIADSSLGADANNLLQRQVFNVEMEGNFAQTQSIIRNIERLQPLLLVRDLNSQLEESSQAIVIDPRGRIVPTAQPEARINTSFQLIALMPAPAAPVATPAPTEGTDAAATDGAAPAASPAPGASPAPAAP